MLFKFLNYFYFFINKFWILVDLLFVHIIFPVIISIIKYLLIKIYKNKYYIGFEKAKVMCTFYQQFDFGLRFFFPPKIQLMG